jgi:decaprenylphospho-beta-D-ribofuranose 2-oxidase
MYSKFFGWGGSLQALSEVKTLNSESIASNLHTPRGAISRGAGRSYGDSSINSGGLILTSDQLKKIEIQVDCATAVVGAGVTIMELERATLPLGLFPFVVPGTAQVTIGGAVASDIHGKSHHRVGSFSNHLKEIKLLSSDGVVRSLKPTDASSKLFWATVGGMGLTGAILEATISLQRIETAYVEVDEFKVKNLDQLIEAIAQLNETHLYTVAWIDLSGEFRGRGLVSAANHYPVVSKKTNKRKKYNNLLPLISVSFKLYLPFKFSLINRRSIRWFNSVWFHKPKGKKIQHLQKYMHPLDGINNWNIIYGQKGFIQYQFVIPIERRDILANILELLDKNRCCSFLSVLKSFGEGSPALLGFPLKGWTLAIDLDVRVKNLEKILMELDAIVLDAGGRIYLTKDSRMNSKDLPVMYPRLNEWKDIKREIDPKNFWQSDQARRLGLC